jgi:hypothetical protein
MKIVLIDTDDYSGGGASRAAYRGLDDSRHVPNDRRLLL